MILYPLCIITTEFIYQNKYNNTRLILIYFNDCAKVVEVYFFNYPKYFYINKYGIMWIFTHGKMLRLLMMKRGRDWATQLERQSPTPRSPKEGLEVEDKIVRKNGIRLIVFLFLLCWPRYENWSSRWITTKIYLSNTKYDYAANL